MRKSFKRSATKKDEAAAPGTAAVPCQPWKKDPVSGKSRAEETEEKLKKAVEEAMEEFPEVRKRMEGVKKRKQAASTSSSDESEDELLKSRIDSINAFMKDELPQLPPCSAAKRRAALAPRKSIFGKKCSLCGSYDHGTPVLGGRIGPSKRYPAVWNPFLRKRR